MTGPSASSPGGRRWRLRALLIGLLPLALAACTGAPTAGPIRQGPVVDSGESTQFIRVIAAPPSAGATPAEVVRGFLDANASLEDDHAIARRYLTPEAARAWQPDEGTTIYGLTTLKVAGDGPRTTASMQVTGHLLGDGSLQTVVPATPRTLTMTLKQLPAGAGLAPEWRITDPPDELLVSDADLRRAYREQQVYFVAEQGDVLVPEGRMLPAVGAALPTALAERVLAGPSKNLAPAVTARSVERIGLAFGAVPVNEGIATVELTDEALALAPTARRALAAELTWTLTELPDITAIRIRVAGAPLDIPGAGELLDRATWAALSPDEPTTSPPVAYCLDDRQVIRVSTLGRTGITLPLAIPDRVTALAVSVDGRRASLVADDGSGIWIFPLDGHSATRRIAGRGIAAGSFDPDDVLWFAGEAGIRRVLTDGTVEPVRITGDLPDRVTQVRVARDGVRVVLVAGGRLYLGVIQVGAEEAVTIAGVHPITGRVDHVRTVAWSSATALAVLGSLDGTGRQVLSVPLGGAEATGLRAPTATRDIAAAPGATTLAATAEGQVFGNIGLQWRQQGVGESVAYPG